MPHPSEPTAQALRASRRDPEAFTQVYRREVDAILHFLALRTPDPQVALDLVAETFAQAYRGRHRFRGRTDAEAAGWLYAIARAQVSRYYRQGFAEQRAVQRLGWALPAWSDDDLAAIDARVDGSDRQGVLGDALDRLPVGTREAVRLRVLDELEYPEIAARLGIAEPAARTRVSRGLRRLADTLALPDPAPDPASTHPASAPTTRTDR